MITIHNTRIFDLTTLDTVKYSICIVKSYSDTSLLLSPILFLSKVCVYFSGIKKNLKSFAHPKQSGFLLGFA